MRHVSRNTYHVTERGFVALMSAIIISVLLLAITLTISLSGYFGRFNVLDSESKERSSALAEACVDTAMDNLAQDSSYSPSNQVVNVGADQCTIVSLQTSAGQTTIKTQAVINKSYTDLKVVADSSLLTITSWDECAVLSSC